ncbi:MAG: adenylosuccinate synthetase [Candidatus Woesebacteria bacterium]|jgi:adenylosuccinate synthase
MSSSKRRAYIVTDLGFGDAGKGSVVDYLTRQAPPGKTLVVRHNGGAQAAHNVVTPDGRHHRFSQFGSGSFVPGTKTHLSRFMVVDLFTLHDEANELAAYHGMSDIVQRLTIDKDALLVTPHQQAANRLRELIRGIHRHGSCGMGIGEAMYDMLNHADASLRVGDIFSPSKMYRRLELQRQLKIDIFKPLLSRLTADARARMEWTLLKNTSDEIASFYSAMASRLRIVPLDHIEQAICDNDQVIFEGAQGVLLDEWRGFHPYTTWSTTTHSNAQTLLTEANYDGEIIKLGLLRAYATRHGAGPLPTEDAALTQKIQDTHNEFGLWQRHFRVGYFDAVTARYALNVTGGVDQLVLTCVDRLYGQQNWKAATKYKASSTEVVDLRPGRYTDLRHQTELTRLLQSCQPQYKVAVSGRFSPKRIKSYVDFVESEIGHKVGLISTGPTANNKHAI